MSPLVKAVCVGLPFVIAITVGLMNLQPAIDEMNAKAGQIETKTTEKEGLETKLTGESKVNAKKRQLEEEIYQLRASVPKQPDLDLFTIDLEKMCQDSNMDLISIGLPKDDKSGGSSSSSSSDGVSAKLKAKQDKVKGLLKGDVPANDADKSAPGAAKKSDEAPGSDLEEVSRQVVVTGSYHNLRRLIHKLETYQRVIKITQLIERIPAKKASEKVALPDESEPNETAELGDPKQLYVSMKVTAYYLP